MARQDSFRGIFYVLHLKAVLLPFLWVNLQEPKWLALDMKSLIHSPPDRVEIGFWMKVTVLIVDSYFYLVLH